MRIQQIPAVRHGIVRVLNDKEALSHRLFLLPIFRPIRLLRHLTPESDDFCRSKIIFESEFHFFVDREAINCLTLFHCNHFAAFPHVALTAPPVIRNSGNCTPVDPSHPGCRVTVAIFQLPRYLVA
jgi:hypothetical protein